MFEYIRTHQRLMQFLLLLIIFPSFAFFGLESYTRSRGANEPVATVAGQSISQQEFDAAQRDQLERLRQMYGPQFDSKLLNTAEARQSILDDLITRKALDAEIAHQHLSVSDQTLQQAILSNPGLMKPDGTPDLERYKSLLAAQGMTPAMYEQRLRHDMAFQQLLSTLKDTAIVPKTVTDSLSAINEQEREVQALNFQSADFASQVKVTDEMLKAYYEKNSAQFEIPETIKAEYVVLNNDVLSAQITVSDAEVQAFYEQNKKLATIEEQRRASHILIAVNKDAKDADKAAAKQKAEKLLADVRKNPESFAKLAKENSQDPVSAERGGDLDYFGKGAMTKAFEDTVFKLKQGEISELVQTEFGYHIIQLTAIKPASVKPLEEMKSQIVADIKKQKASKAYAEAAETFTNTVYEQADSLKPVVDKLKLQVQTTTALTRQPNPALPATTLFNNPKFLKAIFSDEAVQKKHNTEAVEVAPNTLVSGRVLEYKAASKRPFEEVKAVILSRITLSESVALAKKAGEDKLKALKLADNATGFSEGKTISRLKNQEIAPTAFAAVMKADAQKLPAFVGVETPGSGYSIYRIAKVSAGTVDPGRRKIEQAQFVDAIAQKDMFSYIEALKQKSKVTINKSMVAATAPATPQ
ncbi:SurA N-terminal domain-containing protein [Undibacterium sp. Jales W-56]|uniref:SurA N-terminal domain-containing protein n=1 Tax=Undibacterium sp. Jales W-56 TaxID=2897325 RepID=UPI0021D3910A|nr:SurA N-terminal domain-containing protein [Undibacterium sp. Jales W-56]MCU6433784.1 SurA N-terminal domain-containing protein [Undibacterium sp. Jales W-56]